jgi:hypothetical protein
MVKATIKGGRLELDAPPDWPDGTEVEIQPVQGQATRNSELMSPEEIARVLAAMDEIASLEMTEDEYAVLEAERQARKELDKAQFVRRADELRRMWE